MKVKYACHDSGSMDAVELLLIDHYIVDSSTQDLKLTNIVNLGLIFVCFRMLDAYDRPRLSVCFVFLLKSSCGSDKDFPHVRGLSYSHLYTVSACNADPFDKLPIKTRSASCRNVPRPRTWKLGLHARYSRIIHIYKTPHLCRYAL